MVYLLHFDPPFQHARHYLGYTQRFEDRWERHAQGRGARLVQAALAAGCDVKLVRSWHDTAERPADRSLERELKRQKNTPRLCPLCTPGCSTGNTTEDLGDE